MPLSRSSRPSAPARPGRRRALAGVAAVALGLAPAGASAHAPPAGCPGANPACPYLSGSQIGQRSGGVLRFPQAVAVGPDGAVYVADQSSNVVQVFGPDGAFVRDVGVAGTRPGQLGSVGAIAVAPDNTLYVADGSNRIDRYDPSGQSIGSFGSGGTEVGQFYFGAGGATTPGRAADWPSEAASSSSPTAATTASSASGWTAAREPRSSRPAGLPTRAGWPSAASACSSPTTSTTGSSSSTPAGASWARSAAARATGPGS
ncbi:MAG: tripartite motif-containing protein 71 [Solirubrobacteraceae bacterium]|nr:tripartite motif-containing protein 71 [Solirubrobacteraceae bacterium]